MILGDGATEDIPFSAQVFIRIATPLRLLALPDFVLVAPLFLIRSGHQ